MQPDRLFPYLAGSSPTMNDHSTTPAHTRRNFIGKSSLIALGSALGAGISQARESAGSEAAAAPSPYLNARDFGAAGDGRTDDSRALQQAIRQAEQDRVGIVYLPAGTYALSDTLRLPSNLTLVGAGPGLTILQAVAGTLFPLFKPDPRTSEIRQRRSMVTTTSVGTVREQIVSHSGLSGLTIDWNRCPTEGYGSACVLFDSTDDCLLENVHFVNCMPSDHPQTIAEMKGSRFRGECMMFSNSLHGTLDRCTLTDSGYRPLSVAYGSLDITFQNGTIVAENPVWRHAFAEVHGDQMPRDEHYVQSQLRFVNSSFYLKGGTAQDGISGHTGTLIIEDCDFYVTGGTTHANYLVKPFSASKRCQCTNNRFYFRARGPEAKTVSIIGTIGKVDPATTSASFTRDVVFTGNVIDIEIPKETTEEVATNPLINFSVWESRVQVQGNVLQVRMEKPHTVTGIQFQNARNFVVSGNIIEFHDHAAAPGATGIRLLDVAAGVVSSNVVAGKFAAGIERSGHQRGVIVANNSADADFDS
ncbi:glycosyl hydrolase family 28-related protein [Planctomicrobium sp. SH664]|uniref:glycosyl hydrolase family 28-related protein n=1 Tax=Planctomicrobium sp. SH664 TaxID=3448125 RepID=UPI003F5C2F51